MPTDDSHLPSHIEQHDSRTLAISWADGATSRIDVRALRLACGCAHCVDEWSGQPLLAPDSVPEDVAPVGIKPVGRYAIQIEWTDGHDTGIYPYSRLRSLSDEGALEPLKSNSRTAPPSSTGTPGPKAHS